MQLCSKGRKGVVSLLFDGVSSSYLFYSIRVPAASNPLQDARKHLNKIIILETNYAMSTFLYENIRVIINNLCCSKADLRIAKLYYTLQKAVVGLKSIENFFTTIVLPCVLAFRFDSKFIIFRNENQ